MMKKINILYLIDTYLPVIGGAEIHAKHLMENLKNENLNYYLYTFSPNKSNVDEASIIRNEQRNRYGIFNIRDLLNILKIIKKNKIDIIHGHYSYYISFLGLLAAKYRGIPIVVTLHGLGTLDSSVNKFYNRRIYRYFILKYSNIIIPTSEEMERIALRYKKDRKKVISIPNAVDTDKFISKNPKKDNGDIIIFCPRRLNPKNGVQYLIEAIPSIIKKHDNIKVLLVGKDKLETYLRKRIGILKINKYVEFLGVIDNDKMIDYYDLSDIIVFPSSAESISIACLEAMSMEKMIVASELSTYKELIGKNERGTLVNLFDRDHSDYDAPLTLPDEKIELLSNAVIDSIENPKMGKKKGRKARKFVVENYDWKIISKQILNIYVDELKKKSN